MTVKIHIPSSEAPRSTRQAVVSQRSAPGPIPLITAGLVAVSMLTALSVSAVSGGDPPDVSVPAPLEPNEPNPAVAVDAAVWTERTLPGDGEIIAMGAVADTSFAVVRSRPETFIWRLADGAWRLDGITDLAVDSAVVMDNRILLLANQGSRPTVWEWIGGSPRYVFQPTTGSIVGMWSVSGRLFASVAPSAPGLEQTIRSGRGDVLWMESLERDFDKLALVNIESVLAVDGDAGLITVGGRDADGVAAVGFVYDDKVLANPIPGAPPLSAVTELAGEAASLVARVSVANRVRGTHDEIRSAGRDGRLVAEGPRLVGVEVIDDVVVGVTQDGLVSRHRLDGEELPEPPTPPWSYGFVLGLGLLGDEPVAFGQSAAGSPMFAGPSVGVGEIMLPTGSWERYHSEASDGFHLLHVGSLEFAIRDAELFHRSSNAERWRPARSEGELLVHGTPRIVELDWGYVLIPPAGGGMWSSIDGATWQRVDGSDAARVGEVATNRSILVGVTHYGALGGPTSDVTVLGDDGLLVRYSFPSHLIGLLWEDGVGFAGTVAPPGSGYVTSFDGLEWTRHEGPERFDRMVAFDGALYFGSGEPVVEGDPPAETPGRDGRLFSLGETSVFQSAEGATWIHTRDGWVDAGFAVRDGLPGRPDTVVVRGHRAFAMVDGMNGVAETYVLELD